MADTNFTLKVTERITEAAEESVSPEPAQAPFAGQPMLIGESVRRIIDQLSANGEKLDQSYQVIDERAAEGLRITGQDFLIPEHVFNKSEENRKALHKLEAIYDKPLVRMLTARIMGQNLPLLAPKIKPEADLYEFKKMLSSGMPLAMSGDVQPLDAAFEREYLKDAPGKNVMLDSATHDDAGLMADLLKKNPGIALGDIHTSTATVDLLSRNMAMLKANRVDTIYVEEPDVKRLNLMSVAELRQLARDGHYRDIKLTDAQSWAKAYGVERSGNVPRAFVNMMAAAKENNIRIVYMDKDGPARDREAELSLAHRIASDNFIWTDFIRQDRRDNAPDEKYIIFGGVNHFTRSFFANGMVSQALGIPLLAYRKGDEAAGPAFFKADDPNGVDFYLPGGNDYPDDIALLPSPLTLPWIPKMPWSPLQSGIKGFPDADDNPLPPSTLPSDPLWVPLQSSPAFDWKDVNSNTLFTPDPSTPSLQPDKDVIKR